MKKYKQMRRAALALLWALLTLASSPAPAKITYDTREIADDKLIVFASGEITPDDVQTFGKELFDGSCEGSVFTFDADLARGCTKIRMGAADNGSSPCMDQWEFPRCHKPIAAIAFNSAGGSIDAATIIAGIIRVKGWATGVADNGVCASACAVAFAGGQTRVIGRNAKVGVHQATGAASLRAADEVASASAGTDAVVDALKRFGAPGSIIDHVRSTPRDEVYWLTKDDLAQWKVQEGGSALQPPPPSTGKRSVYDAVGKPQPSRRAGEKCSDMPLAERTLDCPL